MSRKILFTLALLFSSAAMAAPQIQIFTLSGTQRTATTARYMGDQTAIVATGLQPSATYTITNSLTLGSSVFQSSATLQSDATGSIDTSVASAASGTYTGVDVDGLFWSMATDSDQADWKKLVRAAPTAPAYQIAVSQNGTQLLSASIPLGTTMPGVKTVSLSGTGLVGNLYLPNTTSPRPAVIAFGGSEGGDSTGELFGEALANAGYVVLGIGYFGAQGLPKTLANIPLEYFQTAITYLQGRPEAQSGQIAVMGMSRGGELALLVGATYPQIKAVVAMVPSPYRWGADDNTAGTSHPNAAWTLNGKALPFLSSVGNLSACGTEANGKTIYCNRPYFESTVAASSATDLANASTLIEQTQGPILLMGGDSDEEWESCPFSDTAMQRLQANHHPYNDEEECYANAGHMGVYIPGAPTTDSIIVYSPPDYMNLGGTPAGDAAAQRAAWTKILQFLSSTFGSTGS